MNCAMAVYDALYCGSDSVLAAEQYIRENGGTEEDVSKFDSQFIEKYGHLTCGKLRGILGNKCNEYVGAAALIAGKMGF